LRAFVAVSETLNVSRAAAKLRVAQPALSRQIRDLECELDVALLDRHPKGVAPTLAGETLARGARQLLADVAAALDRMHASAEGRRGRVVIGEGVVARMRGFTAELQEKLRREHPELTLVVQERDAFSTQEALDSGEIDLALAAELYEPKGVRAERLWEEIIDHAVLPADHPLAQRPSVSVPDLGGLPFILPHGGSPSTASRRGLARLRELGLRSPVLAINGGVTSAYLSVSAGRGWFLSSGSALTRPVEGARPVPLRGMRHPLAVCAVWRASERRPVVHTVVDAARQIARRLSTTLVREQPAIVWPQRRAAHPAHEPGTIPRGLELRHLRALLAVAAAQTIGRAAERLGITQPAVSRQLQELERETGVPLLERSPRGVALTPAGTTLAGECPELVHVAERLVQDTVRARRGMEGRCIIAVVSTAAATELLFEILADASERYPHVHVVIEDLATPLQPKALLRGDIDLGLAHAYPVLSSASELTHLRVMEDRLNCALVHSAHALARRRSVTPTDLSDMPFLFMARSFHPMFYDRLMGAFESIGLTPRIDAHYDGLHTVWALVAQGKGWGLGFASHLARPPAGLVAVPITGLDVSWGLDLLGRRHEQNPAVRMIAGLFHARRAAAQRHSASKRRPVRARAG